MYTQLTRFLRSAANSLVTTENLRNAAPKSGSALVNELDPSFSKFSANDRRLPT